MHSCLLQDLSQLEQCFATREEDATPEAYDAHTFRLFLKVWQLVPPEWKEKCDVPKRIEPQLHRDRVRVDLWSQDTITVPDIVLSQLRAWDGNPSSFLTSGVRLSFNQSENAFTRLFRFMDHSEGEATLIQTIRLRFVQMGMHDLMRRLDCSKLRPDSEAEQEFARRVQVEGDPIEISQKVRKWATVGGKYASLAQDLGGLGAMICIPTDISRAKLERIPPSGETRNQAIALLKLRGIKDVTQRDIDLCYIVARKIWQVMRDDVNSNFLEHAPVAKSERLPKKRKRKNKVNDSGKKRSRYVTGETFHQSLDTLSTTRPSMDCAMESVECNSPVPSTSVLTRISGSPVGSGHSLAVLAQSCPSSLSLSIAQLADNISGQDGGVESPDHSSGPTTIAPHDSETENIVAAVPPSPTQHNLTQTQGWEFWEDMVTVPPPSSSWADFWGEMSEVGL